MSTTKTISNLKTIDYIREKQVVVTPKGPKVSIDKLHNIILTNNSGNLVYPNKLWRVENFHYLLFNQIYDHSDKVIVWWNMYSIHTKVGLQVLQSLLKHKFLNKNAYYFTTSYNVSTNFHLFQIIRSIVIAKISVRLETEHCHLLLNPENMANKGATPRPIDLISPYWLRTCSPLHCLNGKSLPSW